MSSGASCVNFVDACIRGDAFLDEIDDWVDQWHDEQPNVSLDEFLGFTAEEGRLWAEKPQSLRFIVAAHRDSAPVEAMLSTRDDFALAARASGDTDAAEVLTWLRKTGRVSH